MLQRAANNPIITRGNIPDVPPLVHDVSSVFNPGAIAIAGRTCLVLRVQTRGRETVLMVAESTDGIAFTVRPKVIEIEGVERLRDTIYHIYDPRLTQIDDTVYMVFAADVEGACRLGIAATRNMDSFELICFDHDTDQRNGVLFPERLAGQFAMLTRPNVSSANAGVASGSEIILQTSSDLIRWKTAGTVLRGRPHFWDELIGAGPPPIKTRRGWLLVYHGIATHFASCNIYQAGTVLLDLDDPTHELGRTRNNILEPRELWELTGQVPNVVFPSGLVVDRFDDAGFALADATVRVYYGAADTCIGLATTTIGDLIDSCRAD